jgi:SAM-dependent methyltransferase
MNLDAMKDPKRHNARTNGALDQVQAFYDGYPYPPPVYDLEGYRQLWKEGQRLRVEFHIIWPNKEYREDLQILVAGCGTSQAAKHAIRQPAARVTGIDISENSLRHTRELKRKYKLNNLRIKQLPIERVHELEQQFDKIICTGVLHHLADPEAGLRSLRAALKPQGGIYLMVYAAYGRTGVTMLQEYCRKLGVVPSGQEIEDLVAVLKELPRDHPLDHLLRESPDFRHPGALADALLNPRERAYTVPQLFTMLERCGLRFGRWYRQAPYSPQCGVLASIPHAARLTALPVQEQYAEVELFRGTISSHSLIAYRDDSPGDVQPIRFDGDAWLGYVPIRHPSLVCIQERLPSGAAAVLINQDHVDTDLVHPIDPLEKILFDEIDSQGTIADILDNPSTTTGSHLRQERARNFFERLWLYDQAVFDASKRIQNLPATDT